GESSFGVDGHRLAAAERFFHIFGLAYSSMRIAAVEGEVARAANDLADERHVERFAFGNEAHTERKRRERHKNIHVARMIGRKNPGAGRREVVQQFAVLDLQWNSC